MTRRIKIPMIAVLLAATLLAGGLRAQDAKQSEREAMYHRYLEFPSYVKGGSLEPHWMADGSSFWYTEGARENTVIYKVDPKANSRRLLFDAARLRQALGTLLGHEPPHHGLPFAEFTFQDGERAAQFTVESKAFVLRFDDYAVTLAPALSKEEQNRVVPQTGEVRSPDGRWLAGFKEDNLWLRSTQDGRNVFLTADGIEDYRWGASVWPGGGKLLAWSPDSLKIAVRKVDLRNVTKVPIVDWLTPREKVEWVLYPRPGEPTNQMELFILDVQSKRQLRVDTGSEPDQRIAILGWRPDGSELLFARADRLLKRLDVMAANAESGSARLILTEPRMKNGEFFGLDLTFLRDGGRFIWKSSRDGRQQLYLFEPDGRLIRRLTEGPFDVGQLLTVHEDVGSVYFTTFGRQLPNYDVQLYRVQMDGTSQTRLTEATGPHEIQFAPSKQFFLDTHSTTSRPPVTELRRAEGRLLQTVATANTDALKELNWRPPEHFVAKAADGNAEAYGILYKPYDFDPSRKYPVIQLVQLVPWSFALDGGGIQALHVHAQALAQLGFIVFAAGAVTGPGREEPAYWNNDPAAIRDYRAVLKQLGEDRPYMDLSRVGILGISTAGDLALRAMLRAPDVYHVGVVANPTVGNRQGAEPFMGLPETNTVGYEYASNFPLAGNLRGKLLLIHGTSDAAAPLSYTMKFIDALVRAGKSYDLILLPGQGHVFTGVGEVYWREAIREYFQEHLKPQ